MEEQTVKTIVEWSKGKLLEGDPAARVRGIGIDSRKILPGEFFLALPGRNFDGHDYAGQALEKGATGLIVEKPWKRKPSEPEPAAVIRVEKTEKALGDLARGCRALLRPRVVAVTGSNGKTTTKNLIGTLLNLKFKTAVAPASYNNRIGVSLTVLGLEKSHQAAVFELGMNRPGEIDELGRICRPQIGVVLNVGPAHLGRFGGLDRVGRAKAELLGTLEGEKVAFLNYDDPRVKAMEEEAPGPVVGFAIDSPAPVRALDPVACGGRLEFALLISGRKARLRSPWPGRHNLYNLLAALAVADHFGVSLRRMKEAVEKAALPPMRLEAVEIGGILVINDAYNANPASMRAALAAWLEMEVPGKRIAVSGDMLELGDFAEDEHFAWGEELGEAGLDYLVFIGEFSLPAARGALEKDFPEEKILVALDLPSVAGFIKERVGEGDSILLKGSRAMGLEGLVDLLRGEEKSSTREGR